MLLEEASSACLDVCCFLFSPQRRSKLAVARHCASVFIPLLLHLAPSHSIQGQNNTGLVPPKPLLLLIICRILGSSSHSLARIGAEDAKRLATWNCRTVAHDLSLVIYAMISRLCDPLSPTCHTASCRITLKVVTEY